VAADPLRLLAEVPTDRLEALAADEDFVARINAAAAELTRYLTEPRWYQQQNGQHRPAAVAYFSMEFGVT